ncbi:hypothetical protein D9758_001456 [Tetrapyrgos nigripes]|uniref:Polysaccharide lyase 14 domain-containing protein n=1 Tax=Tetrapyrgos nigripes TaxID=182062 RepID=A0A8H5GXT0_9AGAR|nr:hypothetical protein D9758_001456 [Tetrapyrgos nigripes]
MNAKSFRLFLLLVCTLVVVDAGSFKRRPFPRFELSPVPKDGDSGTSSSSGVYIRKSSHHSADHDSTSNSSTPDSSASDDPEDSSQDPSPENSTSSASEPSKAGKSGSNSTKDPDSSSNSASGPSKNSTSSDSESSSSQQSGSLGGLLSMLFPIPTNGSGKSWTTASESPNALPLSDETLVVSKDKKGLLHNFGTFDGKNTMKAVFPKDSYIPSKDPPGGLSFYAAGPADVDLTTALEATLGYSVYFPDGFEWVKGGKLPGLYGGDDPEGSKSCSGGRRDPTCFSVRLMWRQEGDGELYTYLPDVPANKVQCNVQPKSLCNPQFGSSVGRGAFKFATGAWTTVSQRVRLNDPGQTNGQMELFVGGKSVIKVDGLEIADSDKGRIRGIIMQTFFGGGSPDYSTPIEQSIQFADFSVRITQSL